MLETSAYRTDKPDHETVGKLFGQLTVTLIYKEEPIDSEGIIQRARWFAEARCSCGSKLDRVWLNQLKAGKTSHCGCLSTNGATTERRVADLGLHKAEERKLYKSWYGILSRCQNPDHQFYEQYKDRAPSEPEWQDFNTFREKLKEVTGIAGLGEDDTLDREDNNKPYSFANMRIATRKVQALNRVTTKYLLSLSGQPVPFRCVFDRVGCTAKYNTAYARFFTYGWSLASSLDVSSEKVADFQAFPATIPATDVSVSTLGV